MDLGFPILNYPDGADPYDWGLAHGRIWRDAIAALAHIRRDLMLRKNPALGKANLNKLAGTMWRESEKLSPQVMRELSGIRDGSGLSMTDIVILNNYTDFRDIDLKEEGCTSVCVRHSAGVIAAQTWDMHASAKDFLCVLTVPPHDKTPALLILTLAGCVGLMGISAEGCFIGVNNINTMKARAGVIWPVLVRHALRGGNAEKIRDRLAVANVTSGHNYLVADASGGMHIEVAPTAHEVVSENRARGGTIFHTNHCLGLVVSQLEKKADLSSTTLARFDIFARKAQALNSFDDVTMALKDHDGYPKSVCSHYQSGETDPSTTCGGGVADLTSSRCHLWRGCKTYDGNYVEHEFGVEGGRFRKL